jgi:hypothetical protein
MQTVGFEQATIKVDKAEEFGRLQSAVEVAFSADKVKRFLKGLQRARIRIRDFDKVVVIRALESATGVFDLRARQLYGSLTLSDQAQIRELYLSKVETVDTELRRKFKKLFQYY